MENNPVHTFFVILMPRDRIGNIRIGSQPDWPVEVLYSSDVEKTEYKTGALVRLAGNFSVKVANKRYKMSDLFQGGHYLDYLKLEGLSAGCGAGQCRWRVSSSG